MPYHPPKRRKCKKGDGTSGSWVVDKKLPGGKSKQTSCHDSEDKASASIRARKANENVMVISKDQLAQIIREEIKFASPSEKDLARRYRAEKPSEQLHGKKIAAEEIMNLIGRLKDDGYYDATDVLYDALQKLTSR